MIMEILEERVVSSRARWNPRGIKRKMSNFPLRPRKLSKTEILRIDNHIVIIK
jgi:hypothetical protein